MFYVYFLQSPAAEDIYLGFTGDLRRRFKEHQSHEHKGWRLVYYEAYAGEADARRREQRLKHHGSGLAELKKRLTESLPTVRQPNWGGAQ